MTCTMFLFTQIDQLSHIHMVRVYNKTEIAQSQTYGIVGILHRSYGIFHCGSMNYDPIWIKPTKPLHAVRLIIKKEKHAARRMQYVITGLRNLCIIFS